MNKLLFAAAMTLVFWCAQALPGYPQAPETPLVIASATEAPKTPIVSSPVDDDQPSPALIAWCNESVPKTILAIAKEVGADGVKREGVLKDEYREAMFLQCTFSAAGTASFYETYRSVIGAPPPK